MTGAGPRRSAALAAALALVLVAPVVGLVPAVPAAAAATDLTLVTAAAYDVQPAKGLVHVTVVITAKNHRSDTKAQRFYFDSGYLALPPGVSALKMSGYPGATVGVSKRTATSTLVRVGFGGHLYGGLSRTLTLQFDIVDPGGDAARTVRISDSLAVFPVWAFASTGATGSTVSVSFPAGFTATVESGSFEHRETTETGGIRLRTDALAKPLTFFAYVLGERPPDTFDTLLPLDVGGSPLTLTVRAWADDAAWATRIVELLRPAVSRLSDQVGLPWPADSPTVVAESVNRTTGGYAGQFDPAAGRIEIAYWASPLVTLHEVVHGWFNGSMVADRWVAEGFAALYAQRVATELDVPDTSPALTDEIAAARIPLNLWTPAGAAPDPATEAYGFAASLAAATAIAGEAGDVALRGAWADAAARIAAYQPPADPSVLGPGSIASSSSPELVSGPVDWRTLLDLLEAWSGKDLTDAWRTWIVDDAQAPLLDARRAARTAYARTLALADGWALPRSIRDAMRDWRFDQATALLADARAVLAQRVSVEARASRMGLRLPVSVRRLFEAGAFEAASSAAEAENDAMLAIRSATNTRPADPDVLTRLGLLGTDPDGDVAAARDSLEGGSLRGALDAADAATATWAGAWETGRQRAVLLVVGVAVLGVLASVLARWRGRVRPRSRP